jgi:hypothetical protein
MNWELPFWESVLREIEMVLYYLHQHYLQGSRVYMSIELPCIVGMYCWHVLYKLYNTFLYFKGRKLYHIGTVVDGEGGSVGGGIERVQHPIRTCCSGQGWAKLVSNLTFSKRKAMVFSKN